jgi:hypothetical protein
MRRGHAGHAAQQNAAAAALFFEIAGADLHAHAACNLAHGREQRQCSLAVAHRLVGDADDFRFEKLVSERGQRSQMQIGEENQAFAEVDVLLSMGSLTLTTISDLPQT